MKKLRLTMVVALSLAGFLGLSASSAIPSAHAGECYDDNFEPYYCPDPVITKITAPAVTVQGTSNPVQVLVTLTVEDPSDIASSVDFTLMQGASVIDYDFATSPISHTGTTKVYQGAFLHYDWDPWGQFRAYADVSSFDADVEPSASVLTSIKSRSVATNAPSLTTINKGQQFTIRGTLRRFTGDPLIAQRVSIYYVPAGQTRASFAGYATTTASGSLSLAVRAWYTGSWFVSYPGSTSSTDTYKGAWVRVR